MKRLFKILDKVSPGTSRSLGWEALVSALSFPASIMLNRMLGAEDRGILALVILIPSTMFALGCCQWDRLLKGLITSKQISGNEAWHRTKYYAYLLSFIFVPVGIITSLFYDKVPPNMRLFAALYSCNFPVYFLGGCLSAIYVSIGSIDGQYLMRLGLQGSYLISLFGLFIFNLISVESLIFVNIGIHFFSLWLGWLQRDKLLSGVFLKEKPPISPLIRAFFPNLLESFSSKIDIWAFSIFGSLLSIGHYTGITALMIPVGLVSNAMTSGSTARLDWTRPSLVQRYLTKVVIVLLFLLAILTLGGILVGPYLLSTILGKSFQEGYWMIPWIAAIVVSQSAAVQFHVALQLAGYLNEYLLIQSLEPFIRTIIVLTLGWRFSELGILLGLITSSILKIVACVYFHKNVKIKII